MSRARAVVALLVALGLAHAATYLGHGPCDDDYIVYRYGHNVASGEGWVFNPGERVEGFTVPLWTALHAAGASVGADPVLVTRALGLLALAWTIVCAARAWSTLRPSSRFAWPALLVALSPPLAFHTGQGLGTTLLAALVTAAFAARIGSPDRRQGVLRAAAWLGVAALVRHEAVLLAVPLFFPLNRVAPFRAALLAFGPVAIWCAFRAVYFGELVPSTYAVKRLAPLDDLGYGARYLGTATLEAGIGVLLVLVVFALGRRPAPGSPESPESKGGARSFGLGVLLHALYVVAVGGDYMDLARFFVPTLPVVLLLAAWGIDSRLGGRRTVRPVVYGAGILVLQFLALDPRIVPADVDTGRGSRIETRHVEWEGLHAFQEERWLRLGQALGTACPPETRIALSPIGAFGFASGLPIVDLLGLTHAGFHDVAPDLSITMKGHHRYDAEWVLEQEPEVVILGNGNLQPGTKTLVVSEWERTLFEHERFTEAYRSMVLPVPEDAPLVFYVRRDMRPPEGAREIPRR